MDVVTQQNSSCSQGSELLDETRDFIQRFCALPDSHCLAAVALWAVHTHMVEHLYITPRLALLSPEPASGKTRVLEVLELLTHDPMFSVCASPAAIFRTLRQRKITLLFDEVDAIWSRRGKDENYEGLRALLNAGYKRGATIPRCVGPAHDVSNFGVHCAVALAGLGRLPETLMSRSIIIRMRPRGPYELVDEFRTRKHTPEGYALRNAIAQWAAKVEERLGNLEPEMPPGILDRPAELWEPLIAIADLAGGHWPATARSACLSLCKDAQDRRLSLGIRLLTDLKTIFGDADALYTCTILKCLREGSALGPDAPWAGLGGKGLDPRYLANTLSEYGIKPKKIRESSGQSLQGYRRQDLRDAWQRYIPVTPPDAEHPEHEEQVSDGNYSSCSEFNKEHFDSGSITDQGALALARNVPDDPLVPEIQTNVATG